MQPSPVAGLGYVVASVSEPEAWRDFATEVLGAMPSSAQRSDALALRLDDRVARFILEPGDDRFVAVGWELSGREAWHALKARLDGAGIAWKLLPEEEGRARGAAKVLRTEDPSGNQVEFALAPLVDPVDNFVSPTGVRFVTGDQGMGHITMGVAEYDETVRFYTETLGFRVRDSKDIPGGSRATFAGCNPRQHAIAMIDGRGSNFVHHVMLEVDSLDAVGRSLDRVLAGRGGSKLTVGLGRHWNDGMTSFYVASPSGLQIELGFGGRRVDDRAWSEIEQGGGGKGSYWGHHPVPG